MQSVIKTITDKYKKPQVVDVKSGDIVKVHQRISEAGKERIQIFQGLVIRTTKKGSITNRILVRRVASGVGVEKSFLLHSPNVTKVEVTKRSKVRRNYLSYMRQRTGKASRLTGVDFDMTAVNDVRDAAAEQAEQEAKEAAAKEAEEKAAKEAEAKQAEEAKLKAAMAGRDEKA